MPTGKRTTSRQLFDETQRRGDAPLWHAQRFELTPSSSLFPRKLFELKDTPKRLYALGNREVLNRPAIAIVGARKATPYGLECAQRFARKAALHGITVVSGGAIGCDMAAHRGALDVGGTTIVVLGSGADVVYPLRARSLFEEILSTSGMLLSEAPWGSPPVSWAFSRRNRIIAALADATLIVEAGLPSGTFQTADHTLALGNDVLVVPGPIFSKESRGSNRLLAQGAIPVIDEESFESTLDQIFGPTSGQLGFAELIETRIEDATPSDQRSAAGRDPQTIKKQRLEERILTDLSASPMTVDALANSYSVSAVTMVRTLTMLEIAGSIERLRDGRYITRPPQGSLLR